MMNTTPTSDHHQQPQQLECVLCASGTSPIFRTPSELHAHILYHDQDYESEGTLQDDEVIQYIAGNSHCPQCGWEVQGGIVELREHVVNGLCGQALNSTNNNQRRWGCEICDTAFHRRCELKRHESEVHARVRPFVCTIPHCNKTFTRKDALSKHVLVVHQRQRRYRCNECPERFSTNYDLKRHVQRAHQGYRPYRCHMCTAGFTQKSQLTMHKGRTHRFKCQGCKDVFWGEEVYDAHAEMCKEIERHVDEDAKKTGIVEKMIQAAVNNLQGQDVPVKVGVKAET